MLDELIAEKLADAGVILAAEGQGDMTHGHISARLPDNPELFLIKSQGSGLEEITKENLTLCNLAGERLSGGPRHSEVFIHSEIYRARPDVHCVIHTHPEHAVAFSATGHEMRALNQPACIFFESLPTYADSIALVKTSQQGADLARALGPHRAVLMRSHGVAVAGASIEEATVIAILLETACRMELMTLAAGQVAPEASREEILSIRQANTNPRQLEKSFAYLKRKYRHLRQ